MSATIIPAKVRKQAPPGAEARSTPGESRDALLGVGVDVAPEVADGRPGDAWKTVDLLVQLNEVTRFVQGAMLVCNQLGWHLKATRCCLGWMRGRDVRLVAVSGLQKFERRLEIVQEMERVMEEAFDQDEEVCVPGVAGSVAIRREHEAYARKHAVEGVVSLPMRLGDAPVAVLTVERDLALSPEEVMLLRLAADLCTRRLDDLRRQDEPPWRKAAAAARKVLGAVFGVEHTWWKLGAVALVAALLALIFWPWTFRVEAPFTLRTSTLVHVPSPMDGYIESVHARAGDDVAEGDLLLVLDRRDLLVQKLEVEAKARRAETEARSAEAGGQFTEARLAKIQGQQAQAEMELIDNRLQDAEIVSPLAGVVIEGDLRERIGAPVTKGEELFRVARIEGLYLRADVDERDLHFISVGAPMEFAFASQPGKRFAAQVVRIDPAAVAKNQGAVFYVRGAIEAEPEDWWRPGMSGVAKVEVGRRSLLWVLSRRLIDFVRMKLWI